MTKAGRIVALGLLAALPLAEAQAAVTYRIELTVTQVGRLFDATLTQPDFITADQSFGLGALAVASNLGGLVTAVGFILDGAGTSCSLSGLGDGCDVLTLNVGLPTPFGFADATFSTPGSYTNSAIPTQSVRLTITDTRPVGVPAPAALGVFAVGLAGLLATRRRRAG